MTATITAFLTRDELNMDRPRSKSTRINPAAGGVAVHWGGPAQRIRSHDDCVARWRAWQRYHMNTRGWVDIAYTGGVCDHGYAFAGRGSGIRTAANGTRAANDTYYAVVWIGGQGEVPTRAAFDAIDWWIQQLREHGDAGSQVKPHQAFKSTSCPGPDLKSWIRSGSDPTPPTSDEPAPKGDDIVSQLPTLRRGMGGPNAPRAEQQAVRNLQALLISHAEGDVRSDPYTQNVGMDGWVDAGEDRGGFGPAVERVLIKWQERTGYLDKHERGFCGPRTWKWILGVS